MIIVETAAEERQRLMLAAIAEARITHSGIDRRYALDLLAKDKKRRRDAWDAIRLLADANRREAAWLKE